ncbi:C4-dicarboxylate ABC transporter [Ectothiorhodospiraceae bacterium WFHF3C12]|nr:C4-dicarboxylate ABC transporter [Ectothiorhodospiraceae bacterium WFHF3C12]
MNGMTRLGNFPISFFAMVMGLSGLTIAWEKAAGTLNAPRWPGIVLLYLVGAIFLVIALVYALKVARHRAAVAAELRHPVKLSFFPTISISLILLAICTQGSAMTLSFWLWAVGSALHLLFTLYVMNVWMHHEQFQIHHINPAWFIPVVGNILVPIAGVTHGYPTLSWFFFSVGLLFWLVLLTIIFYRMFFHQPLPQKLVPTFFILIAPPAVGFVSYVRLTGDVDAFAQILFNVALFLTLLLVTQINRFIRLRFFLSWWAYSFPLAAMTVATLLMYELTGVAWMRPLGMLLLVLVTAVVAGLLARTALAIARREICVEED